MPKVKDCEVCGRPMSAALAQHADRCKECDVLPARVRIELMVRTRGAKYLGLIHQELRYIRNSMQGGETTNDGEEQS